jgi:hypothetical protein
MTGFEANVAKTNEGLQPLRQSPPPLLVRYFGNIVVATEHAR